MLQYLIMYPILAQQIPAISIDKIERNKFIKGKVSGINPSEYEKLKVLVYVHTDFWYIHPYEVGGAGKSYAKINSDSTWQIGTVRREWPSNQVAALVVDKNYKPKFKISSIEEIPALALIIKDLEHSEDEWDL